MRLIAKIYKELQFSNENTAQLRNELKTEIDICPKKKYK